MTSPTFAWCFSHGTMHRFPEGDEPWCTAAWIAFTAATQEEADAVKQAAYGDARFLHELSGEQQLAIIEIRETREGASIGFDVETGLAAILDRKDGESPS